MSEATTTSAPSTPSTASGSAATAGQVATEAAVNASEQGSVVTGTPPAPVNQQKFKVVVDGQAVELTIDEITKGYQKASSSNKRFQEAARKEKEIEARLAKAKADPFGALKEIGLTEGELLDHMEKMLLMKHEEEKLSPEARRVKELEAALAAKEAEENRRQEEEMAAKQMAEVKHWQDTYSKELIGAMESGKLPRNAHAARKVADIMYAALESGHDLSVEDAIDIFNEDHNQYLESYIKSLDYDQVQKLLGDDFVKKVRKADLEKVQNPERPQARQVEVEKPKKTGSKAQSASEFFSKLDKKYGKYATK